MKLIMVKITLIILILLVIGVVVFTAYMRETNPLSAYETKTLRIGETSLEVLVADTEEKRTKGLMNVTEFADDTGMLFIFPDASSRTFWNKNTLIPLDIIWIAGGRVAGVSSLPSITQSGNQIVSMPSPDAVDWVVEVNAGWALAHGIEVGVQVQQ